MPYERSRGARPRIVLITRFAIRPEGPLAGWAQPVEELFLRSDWLESRLVGFMQWTLPSVRQQTDTDFSWIIALDEEVDRAFATKISDEIEGLGKLVFCTQQEGFLGSVRQTLVEDFRTAGDTPWIVTVRLDSDDCLASDFVETLRRTPLRNGTVTCFPVGLAYDEKSELLFRKVAFANPFIALCSNQPGRHIYELGGHRRVGLHNRLRNVWSARPMWLKVYSDHSTSYFPPNGWPYLGFAARSFRERFPMSALALHHQSWRKISRSAIGFFGRNTAQLLPFVNSVYRLASQRRFGQS